MLDTLANPIGRRTSALCPGHASENKANTGMDEAHRKKAAFLKVYARDWVHGDSILKTALYIQASALRSVD